MSSEKTLYRVVFSNQQLVYEMYAEEVTDAALLGFLKIVKPVFGNQTQVVVDPSEERLKAEFEGVEAFFVPIHNVIRVDEVTQKGQAVIREWKEGANIKAFPTLYDKQPGK